MIAKLLPRFITSPFAQPVAAPVQDSPVMIALPQGPALDDQTMIVRSRLLKHHRDGADLVASLDRMIVKAPAVATQVILAGALGRESERQAAITLRDYARTEVAVAPMITL